MHEIDKTKLSDQTKLRLYEIKNIENYFINEINERKSSSKKLSATTSGISVISFTNVIGTSVGIGSASFNFFFINRNH